VNPPVDECARSPVRAQYRRSHARLLCMNILARRLHVGSTASLPGWRHRETECRQRPALSLATNLNRATRCTSARSLGASGSRMPESGRLRCSGAGYPRPPQGCRRCTRLAVATTLPRVIALGSVCAVRAPGIVARDGGDRCRAARCTSARTCGTSCRRRHRMPDDDHKASKGVDHGRFRALHRFRDSRTRP